jgi:WD40 repeat protein
MSSNLTTSISKELPYAAPYVGLRPFEREEHEIFFGRDLDARLLTNKVFSARLTLLYSQSGLGKSSLLRALVISNLEEQQARALYFDAWTVENPTKALKEAIIKKAEKLGVPDPGAGAPTLAELVRLVTSFDDKSLVLILDQFEEFLVAHGDRLDPLRKELAELVHTSTLDVFILISLRQEFLAALEPFRKQIKKLFDSTYHLESLDDKGVCEAITHPLEVFDTNYEQEFVKRLIQDLRKLDIALTQETQAGETRRAAHEGGVPIDLPLMQLVCSELWDELQRRKASNLSLELYRSLGGAEKILDKYVNGVMPKSWRKQCFTARLMRYLAPPSKAKISYSADDLAVAAELDKGRFKETKKKRIKDELGRLAKARILRTREFTSGVRYELQHDAFIKIIIPWRDRVLANARMWVFLKVVIIFAIVAIFTGYNWWQADTQRNIVIAYKLVAAAERGMKGKEPKKLVTSALLAIESLQRAPTPDAGMILTDAMELFPKSVIHLPQETETLAVSKDGKLVATTSARTGYLWNPLTGRKLAELPHASDISDMAFDLDGKLLTTVTKNDVQTWDAASGTRNTINNIDGEVRVISPDVKFLATVSKSSKDQTELWIWNTVSGEKNPSFVHEKSIDTLTFGPDSSYVATMSGNVVRVWDTTTNDRLSRLPVGQVDSWAFSADGTLLVTAGENRVQFWDVASGKKLDFFLDQKDFPIDSEVNSIALSFDGKLVAINIEDTVQVWNITSGKQIKNFPSEKKVSNAIFSADNKRVLIMSGDSTASIWDIATRTELFRLALENIYGNVAFAANDTRLVTLSDKRVRLWNIEARVKPSQLRHESKVGGVAFSSDGKLLATASEANAALIWDVRRQQTIKELSHENWVSAVAFSHDGTRLATGGWEKQVKIWDTTSWKQIHTLPHYYSIEDVVFSPNDSFLATAGGIDVRLWEIKQMDMKLGAKLSHDAAVGAVAFNPDGKYLATASEDKAVRVWEVASGKELKKLQHKSWVRDVAFDTDSTYLATASGDRAYVWNIIRGEELLQLPHGGEVRAVAFSSDGKRLATASADKVHVWSLTTRELWGQPLLHDKNVLAVAFSPDGSLLATGSEDNVVRLWPMKEVATPTLQDQIKKVCARLPWNLSGKDWDRYFKAVEERYRKTCPDLPVLESG